jgi:hypothetical protein
MTIEGGLGGGGCIQRNLFFALRGAGFVSSRCVCAFCEISHVPPQVNQSHV